MTVEVSISPGVGIFLVGLPDNAVRESLLRVTTAMQRNGFSIPGRKTVVNMAPADIKKEGSGYDAAIAVAMLTASGQMFFPEPDKYLIMGELALETQKPGSKAMLISETNVYPLYGERVKLSLERAGFSVSAFVFPAGEPQTQLSTVCDMSRALGAMAAPNTGERIYRVLMELLEEKGGAGA